MLKLTPRADLTVMFQADIARYRGTPVAEVVTLECFQDFYSGCASIGFADDDTPIGGIIFDGSEAHIAVLPAYHGRWARLLRGALAWLFALQQEIVVSVEPDNQLCIAFMERCGWRCEGVREDGELLYRLLPPSKALPWMR